ncbi:MAG: hypothetical protein IKZ87_05235 [Actinomycetaceae bacterium]|nr:hypothetical protein [Actinomycetaceae bacterium]
MNGNGSVLKVLARYCAIVGFATLAIYVVVNLVFAGGLYGLVNSNSTFGVEQSLGAVGYVLLALCSPAVSSMMLCLGLVFYLTARELDKHNEGAGE